MRNTNIILSSKYYRALLDRLVFLENDRKFCKHNLEHFLDVARICYIISLENNYKIDKDLIYSVALLHDIGRVMEYENNTDHSIASSEIAKKLLEETDFSSSDKNLIINTILSHRREEAQDNLQKIFYKADKLSRMCFNCPASGDCYWNDAKKNMEIKY